MRKTMFGIWPSPLYLILFGFSQDFSFRCILKNTGIKVYSLGINTYNSNQI